ncbi:hypothetical protein [Catenovulum agarivorans]|uniref:hypothetical protein n=1 Tax=Catenovulum agarivorans TaxID=1172192 RepID=UPI0002F5B5BC|nr:hypothetical protein [Catenovulum agarivorans]
MKTNYLFNTIKQALLKNLLPGFVLQVFALSIVLVYFYLPASQTSFNAIAELKLAHGWRYTFIATALFGGLIPFIYLHLTKALPKQSVIKLLCFYLIFWGIKGVEVDLFYQLQGYWFGYDNTVATIVKKTAMDQFIYSALWAAPSITLCYLWLENNFSFNQTVKAADKHFFSLTLPSVIVSNWLVWIPAVSIIYTMPAELQIPLFNLVLCFWVLMLAALNRK